MKLLNPMTLFVLLIFWTYDVTITRAALIVNDIANRVEDTVENKVRDKVETEVNEKLQAKNRFKKFKFKKGQAKTGISVKQSLDGLPEDQKSSRSYFKHRGSKVRNPSGRSRSRRCDESGFCGTMTEFIDEYGKSGVNIFSVSKKQKPAKKPISKDSQLENIDHQ
jgi:hypothetical protein